MVDRLHPGYVNCLDFSGVETVLQPQRHPLLSRTRNRKDDAPIANAPIGRPPGAERFLQHQRICSRKAIEIAITGELNLVRRPFAPGWNPNEILDAGTVLVLRQLAQVRTKLGEALKL